MVQRLDYYTLLARAVESLEPDAYAARGAVYDREHKALLKRLISSASPCSDADIAREEQAFRDAVRRIEFPGDIVPAPRTPQREPIEDSWPNSSREKARRQRREAPQEPANDAEGAPTRRSEPGGNDHGRKPRSLLKLTAGYLLVAALVLGAGYLGYAIVVGALDVSWLSSWSGLADPPAQRAVLYEGGQSGGARKAVEGKAVWRTRTEPSGSSGKPDTVVTVETEIPEQHIALTLTISRVADADAGMSHLLDMRFARPEELPFGGISGLSNVVMKATETDSGEGLVGTSINIAPGQFMFGLLAVPDVAQKNIQRLRTLNWLNLALYFASGAPYTLAIEKGRSGERAINDALAKWGQ